QNDGVCQRAAAGLFNPLALNPGGQPATLLTSPGGAGAVHTTAGIDNPFLPDGATVDVVIRLIDALPPAKPTVELRTPCYVYQVKWGAKTGATRGGQAEGRVRPATCSITVARREGRPCAPLSDLPPLPAPSGG